jgi:hypothetical protein
VTCDERIEAPPAFILTEAEIASSPQAVEIVNYLNAGIVALAQVAAIWEAECYSLRTEIPVDDYRPVKTLLQWANDQFYQAALLWNAWEA